MSNSAIVPLLPAANDETFDSLIESRRRYSPMTLAGMTINELAQIQRELYRRAVETNVIARICLALRAVGSDDGGGGIVWSRGVDRTVRAIYYPAQSTAEITVDGVIVLSNAKAGDEVFIPGQWLYELRDAYDKQLADEQWKREHSEATEKDRLIGHLSAKV